MTGPMTTAPPATAVAHTAARRHLAPRGEILPIVPLPVRGYGGVGAGDPVLPLLMAASLPSAPQHCDEGVPPLVYVPCSDEETAAALALDASREAWEEAQAQVAALGRRRDRSPELPILLRTRGVRMRMVTRSTFLLLPPLNCIHEQGDERSRAAPRQQHHPVGRREPEGSDDEDAAYRSACNMPWWQLHASVDCGSGVSPPQSTFDDGADLRDSPWSRRGERLLGRGDRSEWLH